MSRANDYSESKAVGTAASAAAPAGEVIVYEASDGDARVDVRVDRDTVWLTQRQMAEVFDTSTDNVGLHVKNIFQDGELEEKATAEDFSVVQIEGNRRVRRNLKHYNLDAIISVGYRVNSKRGVRFRHGLNPQSVTALTLLIAESAPVAKDLMVRLVMNMLIGPSPSDDHGAAMDERLRDRVDPTLDGGEVGNDPVP